MKNKKVLWLTIIWACVALLPADGPVPVKLKLPPLSAGAMPVQPNGEFVVSILSQGKWQEAGRLANDRFPREQRLDLAPWLQGGRQARVRIRQQGGGAAHLDAVLLDGVGPVSARGSELGKLGRRDNDLATATDRTMELTFAAPAGNDAALSVTGRIENKIIASEPFQFPADNLFRVPTVRSSFYHYKMNSAAPPRQGFAGRTWRAEVGGRRPFFAVLSQTGSGHPTGYTYGWVSNDERNLYVTIDFTPDNTYDNDKDYAKVYVRGDGRLSEFKVSVPEKRWGKANFVYTDKAAYQHKVYDFAIPLAGLPRNAEGGLDLSFAAYGTAAPGLPMGINLAYDPGRDRYLMVYGQSTGGSSDLWGQFVAADGGLSGLPFAIAHDPDNEEASPVVAFDTVHGRFLVAWMERGDGSRLRGGLFDGDGAAIGGTFMLRATGAEVYTLALAFDGLQARYLFAWDERVEWDDPGSILGMLIDADGGTIEVDGDPYFRLSPKEADADGVATAFDRQSGLYLVVYHNVLSGQDGARKADLPVGEQIVGQMIDGDGGLADEPFAITSGAKIHDLPDVANDPIQHRFLVAWMQLDESAEPAARSLRRRRSGMVPADISPRSVVAGQLLDAWGGALGAANNISILPLLNVYPRLAFDRVHGCYLAVFLAIDFPSSEIGQRRSPAAFPFPSYLIGQYLNRDGMPIAIGADENFLIGEASMPFYPPAVASETVCGRFLAAWGQDTAPNISLAVLGEECGPELPRVETLAVSDITTTAARGGGRVTDDGGAAVSDRGVCWSTVGDPSLADPHTVDGGGLGSFASALTELLPGTLYHVRAYATNRAGTSYGDDVVFTTFRWQVTFLADAGGAVSGKTPQYVQNGGSCTPVAALAKAGNYFRKWDGSDGSGATANPLTVTNVTRDLAFTARFGSLVLSAQRRIEQAWIVRAEYADVTIEVGGLAGSGAAKFLLLRKVDGGDWTTLKEVAPGDFQDGRYTFIALPLAKGKAYTFRLEARGASGELLGASVEVTI